MWKLVLPLYFDGLYDHRSSHDFSCAAARQLLDGSAVAFVMIQYCLHRIEFEIINGLLFEKKRGYSPLHVVVLSAQNANDSLCRHVFQEQTRNCKHHK